MRGVKHYQHNLFKLTFLKKIKLIKKLSGNFQQSLFNALVNISRGIVEHLRWSFSTKVVN